MAMNVGELVATLDVDDKGYTRGLASAATEARTAATLIEKNLDGVDGGAIGTRTGSEITTALQTTLGAARPQLGDAGEDAGEEIGDGIVRGTDGHMRDSRGKFVSMGSEAGGGITGGLTKGLSGISSNVYVMVGLVAAGLALLPLLGATIGLGMALAFGAGIAGVGFAAAAQAKEVQDAFSELKDNVTSDLKSMAEPLEQTLIDVSGDLQELFDSLSPHLEDAFAEMAPVLSDFSDLLFDAFEGAGPVIDGATDAFNSLLDALGPELEGSLDGIWDALSGLFSTIEENPEPFVKIITGALGLVEGLIRLVGWLSEAYVWIDKHVPGGLLGLLSPIVLITSAFKDAGDESEGFSDAMSEMGDALSDAWDSIKSGAEDLWAALEPILEDLWEALSNSDILETVKGWWSDIAEIISLGGELIGELMSLAAEALTWIWENFGDNIIGIFGGLWTMLSGMVSGGLEVIKGILEIALGVITGDWERAWEGVKQVLGGIWEAAEGIVLGAIEVIKNGLDATLTGIKILWNIAWTWIKEKTVELWNAIESTVVNAILSAKKKVASTITGIKISVANGWSSIKTATSNAWNYIKATVVAMISGALATVRNKISQFKSIGTAIVYGIVSGVRSAAGALTAQMRGIASNALSAAKDALGISSPSRAMRDEVGRWIPEGISAGLDLGQSRLDRRVRKMADGMTLSLGTPPPLGAGADPRRPGDGPDGRGSAVRIEHFHATERMTPGAVGEALYGLVTARGGGA